MFFFSLLSYITDRSENCLCYLRREIPHILKDAMLIQSKAFCTSVFKDKLCWWPQLLTKIDWCFSKISWRIWPWSSTINGVQQQNNNTCLTVAVVQSVHWLQWWAHSNLTSDRLSYCPATAQLSASICKTNICPLNQVKRWPRRVLDSLLQRWLLIARPVERLPTWWRFQEKYRNPCKLKLFAV